MKKNKKTKNNKWTIPFKIIWIIIKYLSLGIFYIIKYLFLGIMWIYRKIKKKFSRNTTNPKIVAKYKKFQEIKKIQGNFNEFEEDLESPGKIGIIIGGRGMGKSALGMKIIENVYSRTKKQIYTMGFEEENLPQWIAPIKDISEIENNSMVLIDESGISFSSRNSMNSTNKMLSELLMIARHKDVTIVFIAQNSSNIEINILRQADFILLKKNSLLQMDFERKIIKEMYKKIGKTLNKIEGKGSTYIYSTTYEGIAKNDIPSFWNEKLSKSFSEKK